MTKARSNATANAAKGDLTVGTGTNLSGVLSAGNNGEALVLDSSTATGLRYQGNFAAGKNKIINGDFGIWQRGTSFSGSTYNADRWVSLTDATVTTSQQTFTAGTAPVAGYEGTYFQRTAKSAGGSYTIQEQRIEDVRVFAGQTVTLSFWAKADANVSCSPSFAQFFNGSATVDTILSSVTITTTWARYSFTVALPGISGKTIGSGNYLAARPIRVLGSAATTIDLWGVQLEASNTATAFQTATGTIQGELAACQRYFQKSYDQATAPGTASTFGSSIMAAPDAVVSYKSFPSVIYPVTMRGSTTITIYNPSTGTAGLSTGVRNTQANTDISLFVAYQTQNGFQSYINNSSAGVGAQLMFHYTASSEL